MLLFAITTSHVLPSHARTVVVAVAVNGCEGWPRWQWPEMAFEGKDRNFALVFLLYLHAASSLRWCRAAPAQIRKVAQTTVTILLLLHLLQAGGRACARACWHARRSRAPLVGLYGKYGRDATASPSACLCPLICRSRYRSDRWDDAPRLRSFAGSHYAFKAHTHAKDVDGPQQHTHKPAWTRRARASSRVKWHLAHRLARKSSRI